MRRWTPGRTMAALAVVAMLVFWGWLLLVADPETPDVLDDPEFGPDAQAHCAQAGERIDLLPPAEDARSPEDRALIVAAANEILHDLLDDLRGLPTGSARDTELVRQWLDDWETYLGDRELHAQRLAAGEDAELLVTARGGRHISVTIDNFAVQNRMPDCQVPLDV